MHFNFNLLLCCRNSSRKHTANTGNNDGLRGKYDIYCSPPLISYLAWPCSLLKGACLWDRIKQLEQL